MLICNKFPVVKTNKKQKTVYVVIIKTCAFYKSRHKNMLTPEEKQYLDEIWTNVENASAFAGPMKLYQYVKKDGKYKIGLTRIKRYLSNQRAYSLQKRIRRNFKRARVESDHIDQQWDGDLMFLRKDKGYGIVFVLIDIFSRYIFTIAIKDKKAATIIKGLSKIFTSSLRRPEVLRFDKGEYKLL